MAFLDLAERVSRSGDGQRVRVDSVMVNKCVVRLGYLVRVPADRRAQGTYCTAPVPYAYGVLVVLYW